MAAFVSQVERLQQNLYRLQSLTYLLPGPLQKKFAESWPRALWAPRLLCRAGPDMWKASDLRAHPVGLQTSRIYAVASSAGCCCQREGTGSCSVSSSQHAEPRWGHLVSVLTAYSILAPQLSLSTGRPISADFYVKGVSFRQD